MNYQEFVSSVTGFLREAMPEGTEFNLVSLEKNNGITKEGLSVRKQGRKVAPTIYLEAYYGDFLEGRSIYGICERIMESCEECGFMEDFDVDFFLDYEKIRSTIVYKLINREKNKELLEDVPHLAFLDLALVFYCLLSDTPVGQATVLIHNSHMDLWKVSNGELYRDAKANSARLLPAELKTMGEVIRELSGEESEEAAVPMYVLTNTSRTLGAVSILYEGMMEACAKKLGGAYYLLPSSIHELILVPKEAVSDQERLVEMVRDINHTQVKNTEVLSDHIYFYLPGSGQLSLAGV